MLKYLYLCVAVILITTISGCSSTPPPSNGLIAFISDRGGTKDIYIMKADGTGQTQLTKDSGYYDWLDWSPNGKKLSFGTIIGGKREIFVMNSDGSNQTQLTFEGNNDQAEWSPDSSMIAFVSDRDIDDEVYVMGADGSNQTNLTKNPHEADITPVWSPNGNEIFYLSQMAQHQRY